MKSSQLAELTRWRAEALAQLQQSQGELAELQKQVRARQEKLELVERLLSLEGGDNMVTKAAVTGPDALLDACEEIIRAKGHPIHISEIHSALIERGVPIPGKGDEANIIVRLQRASGRFIRTGRGTYGLSDFGVPEVRPVRTVRRSRRAK